jgi:hypothetical protein
VNGIELYGKIVPQVLLDGRIIYGTFTWDENLQSTLVTVPYFWDYVGVYSFSSLLASESLYCNSDFNPFQKLIPAMKFLTVHQHKQKAANQLRRTIELISMMRCASYNYQN